MYDHTPCVNNVKSNCLQFFSGPNIAPVGVKGYYTSSTSLFVEWNPLSALKTSVVVGYIIKATSLNDTLKVYTKEVNGLDTSSATLNDLDVYTMYSVVVSGRSATYEGLSSKPIILFTDIDGEIRIKLFNVMIDI